MSENQAKAIKFTSLLGCFLGSASAVTMAFVGTDNPVAKILWLVLSVAFLLLIYPLFQVASVKEQLLSQEERLRILAKAQSKLSQSSDAVDRYSPLVKSTPVRGKAPTGASTSIPNAAERTLHYEPIVEDKPQEPRPKQPTGDLTREFSQQDRRVLNEETGELSVEEAERQGELTRTRAILNVGSDTFEYNRKYKAITRFVPTISAQTISAGGVHTVVVRRNGYAAAVGFGQYGQCDVSGWRDIVSVAAGNHHSVGLRSDGTCVACGYTGYGQCDVGDWHNICSVAAGASHTVGLLEDGTCVAVGDNTFGQCNVYDWSEIISIVANANYTVGLRVDGTIVAVGANTDGQWGAIKWGGITAIAAGGLHTIGLRSDGTCVSVGNNANNQCEVSRWNKIVAIAAGNFHTVGLKEDGRVIAVGHNSHGQCNVSEWTNIIAVAAGRNHTVALDRTGKVFATGDNGFGQCTVRDFTDIKTTGV